MKIKLYILILLQGLLITMVSCSDPDAGRGGETEGVPVDFSGIMTRSDGITGANIYLTAFYDQGGAYPYMSEVLVSFPAGLGTLPTDASFPGAVPYYPLDFRGINFFAYSGKSQNQHMVVVAGNSDVYDAVLSNRGYTGGQLSQEGSGTFGSSDNPADILVFRHVMTQLNVSIEVNENEEGDHVSPDPQNVWMRLPGVYAKGTYGIRSSSITPAVQQGTGLYTVRQGVNYLVATGADLTGTILNYLKIDDYTATAEDLAQFAITADNDGNRLILNPGYSYNLTLVINRLRVTEVKISLVPWKATIIDNVDETYVPATLSLNTGSYLNNGDDAITKVVLYTADKMYVGEKAAGSALVNFVKLPGAGDVTGFELYTAKGMLLSSDNGTAFTYDGSGLGLQRLSAGGMLPQDPSTDYNSADNPYMITTASQFINVRDDLTASYRQGADIDLNTLNLIDEARLFNGFGAFASTGVYDGNGYVIQGLDIQSPGLFLSNAGTLRNIRIMTGMIDAAGQQYVGSMCGENSGTVVACFNEAAFISSGDDSAVTIGGIVGRNTLTGVVTACLNTGNIFKGNIVGGIAGVNENPSEGTIRACINTGMLNKDASRLGAICGNSVASSSGALIRSSYWLVGTAQRNVGGSEKAVDADAGTTVGLYRSGALDPDELRDITSPFSLGGELITDVLNDEIAATAWNGVYQYIINRKSTGITWPAPVKM